MAVCLYKPALTFPQGDCPLPFYTFRVFFNVVPPERRNLLARCRCMDVVPPDAQLETVVWMTPRLSGAAAGITYAVNVDPISRHGWGQFVA